MNTEKSDNEIIAEFMGAKKDTKHAPVGGYWWYDDIQFGQHLYYKEQLAYSRSWNWLMPVVEKIKLKCAFSKYDESIERWENVVNSLSTTNITAVYSAGRVH